MAPQSFILGFRALSWHFFEARHGKRSPDGVGGAIKRNATKLMRLGKDICDARILHDILLLEKHVFEAFLHRMCRGRKELVSCQPLSVQWKCTKSFAFFLLS